jgi:hypothetical protein
MTDEEMRQLRKNIKQETMGLIEKHNQQIRATQQYYETRLHDQNKMIIEIQRALNIITDKLIDHVVKNK